MYFNMKSSNIHQINQPVKIVLIVLLNYILLTDRIKSK